MVEGVDGPSRDSTAQAFQLLAQWAPEYIQDSLNGDFLSHLLKIPDDPVAAEKREEANIVFDLLLLPKDLESLVRLSQDTESGPTANRFELFRFMSSPVLSGFNVRLSGGPRPRIRGGNGHLPEIRAWDKFYFGDLNRFRRQ